MKLKYCPVCAQNGDCGYFENLTGCEPGWGIHDSPICFKCNGILEDTLLSDMEADVIMLSVDDFQFLKSMVELKENDIIEYAIRYQELLNSQLRKGRAERDARNIPKCPTCNSTNIEKISTASKVAGAVAVGILSSNVRNTFKCKNCGYKW